MKKIIFIYLFFDIIFSLSTISYGYRKKVTFAFEDKESFPFYMGNGKKLLKNKPGGSVEIIQTVADKLDIKVNWKRFPWKRCLSVLGDNNIDGTFNASYKREREKAGVYPTKNGIVDESRRLVTVHYSFYKIRDSKIKWDGRNLLNFNGKIGVVLGYSVEKELKKKGFTVDTALFTKSNIEKLVLGRVNLIAGSKSQIDSFLQKDQLKFKNVVEIKTPLKVKSSYLIFSHKFFKENPELSEEIWDTIREIRNSKKYKETFEKYY